jgi:hypothetical protein
MRRVDEAFVSLQDAGEYSRENGVIPSTDERAVRSDSSAAIYVSSAELRVMVLLKLGNGGSLQRRARI